MPKYGRTKNVSYLEDDETDESDDETDESDDETDESDDETDESEEDEDDLDIAASEDEEEEEKPRQKSTRANDRIRKLAKERKEARDQLATLQAQIAADNNQRQQRSQQPTEAEEAAFRATLAPEDLIRYDVNKILRANQQQTQLMQFNMADMMDKQAFDSRALVDPTFKKYANEVEKRLLDLRTNQRMNVPRGEILKHILGEMVLSGKHKTTSRDKAKQNLKNNKTKVSSNRSDTTREVTRSGSEREKRRKRLEGVQL